MKLVVHLKDYYYTVWRMVEQCPPKDIHGLNSSTNEHATLHYLIKGNEMRRLCRLT